MARPYRTLGELRAELRAILGFASSGAAAGPNQTLIDAQIRNAQTSLYWSHDWAHLRKREDKTLGVDEFLLDYPTSGNGANPDRVRFVSALRGGVWSPPLQKGITSSMYTYQDNPSWPQRWEPYEQLEIWPKADQIYTVRIFYIENQARFTQDTDRCSIDDTVVQLVATAVCKAHYRQPDAEMYQTMSDNLLAKLKAKSWGQDVFRPDDWVNQEPLVRPVTV